MSRVPFVFKIRVPKWVAQSLTRLKHEYRQQDGDRTEFTEFTLKLVAVMMPLGYIGGGLYSASRTQHECERKGRIVFGSVVGTVLGALGGAFWTTAPLVVGVPYCLYKGIEVMTRPNAEELKKQSERRYGDGSGVYDD